MADTATTTPAASTPSAPTSGTSTPTSNGATGPQTPVTKGPPASNEPMKSANEPMETPEAPAPRKYKYQAEDGTEAEATLDDLLKDYKRKIKVGEEERELGLDELEKGYLRRDLFDRKVSEAHRAMQEAQQFQRLLQERPVDLLRHMMKGDENQILAFAKALVDPYVRRAEMTPEQRALDEEREQLNQQKAEIERWRQEQEEAKRQARLNQVGKTIDQQFHTAMTKHGLDPTDMLMVGRLAMAREWALDNGLPYSYDDLAQDLAQKEQARIEAAAKKLEQQRLEKLRATPMQAVTTPGLQKPANEPTNTKRPWQSPDEYLESLSKKFG